MKTRLIVIVGALLVFSCTTLRAQETVEPDIQKRLDLIRHGNIEQVRSELPSLMAQYSHNPGLLYLQGVLTTDGGEAVRIFQNLADNYPKSEWADDALFKTYQYYYALGLYQTADQKLERLKRDYPQSPFLRSVQQQVSVQPGPAKEPAVQPAATQQESQPVIEKKEAPTAAAPVVSERQTPIAATPAAPEKKTQAVSPVSGRYTVQTGVFSSRQNAEKFQGDLNQAGISADIRPRQIGGREMYRVCVGSYATYEEAQKQAEILKGKNITGIVTGW